MPNIKQNIFNRKKLNFHLERVEHSSIPEIQEKQEKIKEWVNYIQSGNIENTKEIAIKGNFLEDIFSNVLGFKSRIKNIDLWNINQEQLTLIDSKSSDAALGFFTKTVEDVKVVIEIKDASTNLDEKQHRLNDTRTPIEQAFSYQHKTGTKCKWIIVSNFKEIRLYHNTSSTEYELFVLTELGNWEQFRRFYYLLSLDNLIAIDGESLIDSLYAKNEAEEINISKKFYTEFKQLRTKLFNHLKYNNPTKSELLLLEKTQKFLDRFIFVCFCEDNRLLPEKTYKNTIEIGKRSFSRSKTKIWNELKGLFEAINEGSLQHNINNFNGGLFAEDDDLDSLVIRDGILTEFANITDYDFETEIDVNILGHIFEQSISDIEEIKAGIEGRDFDKKTSKRKKEGIYYTPEYITKYIVENAVGGWLEDRKKELGFYELPELSNGDFQIKKVKGKLQLNEKQQKYLDFWVAYKEKLMNIKVLDPACGSGAFLNQAFNFLYSEGQKVNEKIAELTGEYSIFGLDQHILSNNLYGVDLNNESVEITKLSLWIKTANIESELTFLDKNIRCGNSLIDDPDIAGEKAFNWNTEFPEIMQEKLSEFQFVTFATKYSRMRDEEIPKDYNGEYVIMTDEERLIVSETIKEKSEKFGFKVLAVAILPDHVHLVIACMGTPIEKIVNEIKGKSSYSINHTLKGVVEGSGRQLHHWARRFDNRLLNSEEYIINAINYVNSNYTKHEEKWGKFDNTFLDHTLNGEAHNISTNHTLNGEAHNISTSHTLQGVATGMDDLTIYQNYQVEDGTKSRTQKSMNTITDDISKSHTLKGVVQAWNNFSINHTLQGVVCGFTRMNDFKHKSGGFDVVIGNPPYVDIKGLDNELVKYLFLHFISTANRINLFSTFIERGIKLLKNNGYHSFIVPNSLLMNSSYTKIRRMMIDGLRKIIKLPDNVFEEAIVETVIYIYKKGTTFENIDFIFYPNNIKLNLIDDNKLKTKSKSDWYLHNYLTFNIFTDNNINSLLGTIENNATKLEELVDFTLGITPYDKYNGHSQELITERRYHSKVKFDDSYQPLITGKNIFRYYISEEIEEYIKYGEWLGAQREERFFTEPRIIVRQIVSGNPLRIYAGYTDVPLYFTQIGFGIIIKQSSINLKFLLSILNSKLINFYHKFKYLDLEKNTFQKILIANSKNLPIKVIDESNQQPFVAATDIMLEKNKELQNLRNEFLTFIKTKFEIEKPSTKLQNWYELNYKNFLMELTKAKVNIPLEEQLAWQNLFDKKQAEAQELKLLISETDKKIDLMVYKLYELTYTEVKIVDPEFEKNEEEYNNFEK